MRPALRHRSDAPLLLRGGGGVCRVRPWPHHPQIAHLMFYSQAQLPSADVIGGWLRQLRDAGFTSARTGAVGAAIAEQLRRYDFHVVQTLCLLEHGSPAGARDLGHGRDLPVTSRLLSAWFPAAAGVDVDAFGPVWGTDEIGVSDICAATQRHRARAVLDDGAVVAYAISGRDGRTGFLQRLAVHPDHQGKRIGLALTLDSLAWMARWRVQRALVNTHVDNDRAQHLYARAGFTTLPERLQVMERLDRCEA